MKNKKRTKLFFDTEFTGLHQGTKLISIGLVSEQGLKFYGECTQFDDGFKTITDRNWVHENVIPKLELMTGDTRDWSSLEGDTTKAIGSHIFMGQCLATWLRCYGEIEMWSDTLSYDWVLFNDLWGHAFNLPESVYSIPFDIATLLHLKGVNPDINREEFAGITEKTHRRVSKHNALWDALVIKACYEKAILLKDAA